MALHSWELQKAIYAHMNGSVTGIGGSGTESLEYAVTVQGGVFYIDGAQTPTLTLKRGSTYKFKQDDASNGSHPFYFSTTSDGTHGGGSQYTNGVTHYGTAGYAGSYSLITVAANAPDTLYYYCANHGGMGGQLTITAAPTTVNVPVYDDVPEETVYPYVILGEETATNDGSKTLDGVEHTLTIHAWSQYRGRREIKEIMQSVYSLLHNSDITVSGASLVNLRQEFATTLSENDNITRHGVMRFRAVVFDS